MDKEVHNYNRNCGASKKREREGNRENRKTTKRQKRLEGFEPRECVRERGGERFNNNNINDRKYTFYDNQD